MALVESSQKSSKTSPGQPPATQRGIRNTLIGLVGIMALMLGILISAVLDPKGLSSSELQTLGYYGFDKARPISDFSLINHRSENVGLEQLKDQWSLLFFGFTFCPDVCPTTLGVLNRAVKGMSKKPQVIMVSVDPERDTPALLAQYLPGFNPDFVAYTGEFDQIVALATQLNSAFGKVPGEQPGTYTVDHTASIVVVNPNGEYQGFIKAPHQALKITQIVNSLTL